MRLLEGAARSHGTHDTPGASNGSPKRSIRGTARTVKEPVTEELWQLHLGGLRPLGIVPIREDDHCLWGAVDVDDYSTDVPELVRRLEKLRIPAVVCRTKSGGAHVYLFFLEPVPARDVLPRLRELAAALGHGGSEIFPKQESVLASRGDFGSWLNMPYLGALAGQTERCAVLPNGNGMTAEEFLDLAEARRMSPDQLRHLVLRPEVPEFSDGPPCLEILAKQRVEQGAQSNFLLSLGVFAKKKWPEAWEQKLEEWNRTLLDPPGSSEGLQSVIRSLRKKPYQYKCKDKPIVSCCNSALCRTRIHGVGSGGAASPLESLSILKTDPPVYFVVMKDGRTVEVDSRQMLSNHDFQIVALDQCRTVVPEFPRNVWTQFVRDLVDNATEIDTDPDAGTGGSFREILEEFLTDRYRSETRDGLLDHRPWRAEEEGRIYFKMEDLMAALSKAKFVFPGRPSSVRSWTTARIRAMGGDTRQMMVKKRNINVWWLSDKTYTWDAEPLDLPPGLEPPL